MYSSAFTGWFRPCCSIEPYRAAHFCANSLPGSSRGMKLGAKALVRPFDAVPTTLVSGICNRPSEARLRAFSWPSISSSTGKKGLFPRCMLL